MLQYWKLMSTLVSSYSVLYLVPSPEVAPVPAEAVSFLEQSAAERLN